MASSAPERGDAGHRAPRTPVFPHAGSASHPARTPDRRRCARDPRGRGPGGAHHAPHRRAPRDPRALPLQALPGQGVARSRDHLGRLRGAGRGVRAGRRGKRRTARRDRRGLPPLRARPPAPLPPDDRPGAAPRPARARRRGARRQHRLRGRRPGCRPRPRRLGLRPRHGAARARQPLPPRRRHRRGLARGPPRVSGGDRPLGCDRRRLGAEWPGGGDRARPGGPLGARARGRGDDRRRHCAARS